jgi:TonB-linked SusC/RagA family outer membrane protein
VLKDADATAIYGSRGANGVILITTKKGKAGQTTVDANIYSGSGKVAREMDLLNTSQYLAMRHEAFNNDGLTLGVSDYDINGDWDSTRYTNWQKVLIGNTASFTNAQLNISGGNTNTQFVIGGGYSNQGTVYPGDNHDKKTSAHVNLTHNSIDQRFHLVFSTSYVNDNSDLPNLDLTSYITLAPDAPEIYDANGNLNWQFINGSFTWLNPLRYIVQHDNAITKALVSNLNLDYKLLPGLSLKANIGYTHSQYGQTNLSPSTYWFPPLNANPSFRSIALASAELETWIVEPQAAYRKKMGKGVLDCLVGTTFQQSVSTDMAESASGFASDALISDPVAASNFYIDGNDNTIYRYNALFGRIGYSWAEKYLLNLTGRRDGSSRFGPGKQFGNFGAVGSGWIFSKESFVQNNLGFLSFGKIRASYGSTGNDGIRDYEYLSTYTPASPTYQNASTLSPTQLTNPNFAWETVKKLEGGVDLGFLKDRILLSIGAYRNRTDNQLVGYSLPSITGFTSVQYNLPALVQNTGTEYTISTVNIRAAHFSWTSSLNLSFTSNKLVSYPNIQSSTYEFIYAVGKSMFSRLVFHNTGVDPQTGIYIYATKNANNAPSFPQDLISSQPITQKYFGGIQNSFTFKGFRLDFLFQFVKQLAQNYLSTFNPPGQFNFTSSNEPVEVLNRWQKPGDVTNIAKFSTNSSQDPSYSLGGSDRIFGDASFIRLKNLALSYQLPLDDRRKLHLVNARIYINAQNVLTFTKYQGLDPETGGLNLPPLRMFTGGIQLTF